MDYKSMLKLSKLKNNAIPNETNVPYDPFIQELERLNKVIWQEDDYLLARNVIGVTNITTK
ncbi:MAG: hypothetical protein ACRC7S_17455 [Cetobacterium sp.]